MLPFLFAFLLFPLETRSGHWVSASPADAAFPRWRQVHSHSPQCWPPVYCSCGPGRCDRPARWTTWELSQAIARCPAGFPLLSGHFGFKVFNI